MRDWTLWRYIGESIAFVVIGGIAMFFLLEMIVLGTGMNLYSLFLTPQVLAIQLRKEKWILIPIAVIIGVGAFLLGTDRIWLGCFTLVTALTLGYIFRYTFLFRRILHHWNVLAQRKSKSRKLKHQESPGI